MELCGEYLGNIFAQTRHSEILAKTVNTGTPLLTNYLKSADNSTLCNLILLRFLATQNRFGTAFEFP